MDLPDELVVVHDRTRLRILGLLYRENDLAFGTVREALGLTPGNLASHVAKLDAQGLVTSRDVLARTGFERRIQITAEGIHRFDAYLGELERFVAAARAPLPDEATGPDAAPGRSSNRNVTRAMIAMGGLFVLGEAGQKWLADASGSDYVGIVLSGAVLAMVPVAIRLPRWVDGRRGR